MIEERIVHNQNDVENIYNEFEAEFNRCVPKSGYANTVAGEILRAWMRVLYRAVNDGDLIGDLENNGECESAAAYVYSNICKYGDTYDIHDLDLSVNWDDQMDFINGNIIHNKVHNLLTYHKAESQLIDEYLCIHKQNAGFILDWLKANPILYKLKNNKNFYDQVTKQDIINMFKTYEYPNEKEIESNKKRYYAWVNQLI